MAMLSREHEDEDESSTPQIWLRTPIPWDLVKVQMLMQEAWAGLDSTFLTRPWGMLGLLVHGPHSEERGPKCLLGKDKRMSPPWPKVSAHHSQGLAHPSERELLQGEGLRQLLSIVCLFLVPKPGLCLQGGLNSEKERKEH